MRLYTRIPIEECETRLASAVDIEKLAFSWSGYAGSKPILARLSDTSFRLQARRYYHKPGPYFFGEFLPSKGGTIIEGEFGMHPNARAFMFFWFSFLALGMAFTLIRFLQGELYPQTDMKIQLLVPIGMMAFGFALIKFSRWLGRGEERDIVGFLKTTLEANDADQHR